MSKRGRILSRAKSRTPFAAGGAAVAKAVLAAAADAIEGAGAGRLAAIGIGSPGPIDPDRGVVLRTPNISVKNLKIRELLSGRFGVPVVLDNDVHMALWGEFLAGAGRGCRSLVGIWVGTGVGGGVIVDGRLVRGSNRNAGEIGHMVLDARRARAGRVKGTLEGEASKTGIARLLRRWIRDGERTALAGQVGRGERLDSSALGKAYRDGDPLARRAIAHSARYVGIAVADLFNVLSPELFILGGGVVEDLGAPYLAAVRETARKFAFSSELAKIRVVSSRLGDDAGILGAAFAAGSRPAV